MGLFDMFKGDTQIEMTPKLAFTVSLLYMVASDGGVDTEEVGQLLSVIGEHNRDLLDLAVKYARNNNIDQFLPVANSVLNPQEKMCVLLNLLDSLLSNGQADRAEQELFARFLNAFGVSEGEFQPYFDMIALKNDKSMFNK